MKTARIWEHLNEADAHLSRGEARIKSQEERVKELTSDGRQTKNAEETLKCFQDLLGNMKKHRDLVREELKKAPVNSDSRVREVMLGHGSAVKDDQAAPSRTRVTVRNERSKADLPSA
jgi:hypothetical protein